MPILTRRFVLPARIRSGTSIMLTRLLHACGLYVGEKNELMPSQADNPDGFWEHLGFVALNDELLNALGENSGPAAQG